MKDYVVANDYLCFMALLEMIVSEACPEFHFSQTDFAEQFGITIPFGENTSIKNVHYSDDIRECGTHICINNINDFFKRNMIPLHLSFISSCFFDEINFSNIIIEKSKNCHIVFAFCYGLLFNEAKNDDVGHVALFEDIDTSTDKLWVYDPGPRNHGRKDVKIDDLVYAMKKRGGIYLFNKM